MNKYDRVKRTFPYTLSTSLLSDQKGGGGMKEKKEIGREKEEDTATAPISPTINNILTHM